MTTDETQTTQTATTTEGAASTTVPEGTSTAGALLGQDEQQNQQAQQPDGVAAVPAGETTPETKPDAKAEGKDDGKLEGAPEKYDFKAPEGSGGFDPQVLDAFSAVAKDLDLPQDKAQQILDKVAPVIQARQAEQVQVVQEQWVQQAKADKEFGGEKLSENLGIAKKALDEFTSSEMRKLLVESGLGNHPEVIRTFYRVGKAISEDRFVPSGRANAHTKGLDAKRLYPNSNMN